MSQLSVAVRNARANAIETAIGASAKLYIFSGAKPANIGDADPAGLLATLDLPADWAADAVNGVVAKAGTWTGTGSGAGTAQSFRIKNNAGSAVGMQGTAGGAGSGMEMILDNAVIAVGQTITVNSYTWTEGNA